ncbi:signal peptidase I [Candidatus Peregrinibacteria bacterium CG10_big_fil_rev_8_21_14_0_10_42_8]|nr:MAG: signal peptidase I [Candidatus Peregrinibacteria bacterium CG10_big_fil_rev_8_21_14_0_10_42_8]
MSAKKHTLWFHLFDVLLNIVIIVAIVATIRTFLISPFQVEGKSMMSTLEHEEYIVINKLAYYLGSPNRGDVVVFRPPNNPKRPYVKRVIGLPGDEVIISGGFVSIRPAGSEEEIDLDERYLNDKNAGKTYRSPPSAGNTDEIRYRVPEGKYFLLGDNRVASLDSRSFRDANDESIPFVDEDSILGRVWVVALPLSKVHAIEHPSYGF